MKDTGWGAESAFPHLHHHSALKDLLQPRLRSLVPPGIRTLGKMLQKGASNASHTWASGALRADPAPSLLRKQRKSSLMVPHSFLPEGCSVRGHIPGLWDRVGLDKY